MTELDNSADPVETVYREATQKIRRGIAPAKLSYVPALDGLRAVSVLAVMLYHARFGWISGGFLGVSTFFTLSGFLITSLLLREWCNSTRVDLRGFWGRRFRRLLPASWLTMLVVVALGAVGAWNSDQLRALRGDVPFSLLEIVNWHFIFQDRSYGAGFVAPSPLEHFWSLAVEEQFYLILPGLVILLLVLGRGRVQRVRLRNLTVVLSALMIAGMVLNGILGRVVSTDRAYFGTDSRMAEMLVGSLLACLALRELRFSDQRRRRLAGGAGIAGLAATLVLWNTAQVSASWMYPWGFIICAASSASIILAALQGGIVTRLLSLPPLVWLGRISYGVYLLHWPVFVFLTPARTGLGAWPLFGIRLVVTLAAATLMFYLVEDPIRRRRRLPERRLVLVGGLSLAVLLLSLGLVTRDLEPVSFLQRAAGNQSTTTTIPVPPVRLMVIGDQFAGTLATSISKVPDLMVTSSVVPDCGFATGGWVQLRGGTAEQDVRRCRDTLQKFEKDVTAEQPDVVLITPSARDAAPRRMDQDLPWTVPGDPGFEDALLGMTKESLDELISSTKSIGTTIVVASSPPVVQNDPVPLPPREKYPDPEVESLRSLFEANMKKSQPPLADQAVFDTRTSTVNAIFAKAAESRSLHVLDIASYLAGLEPAGSRVDLQDSSASLEPATGTKVGEWILGELRRLPKTSAPVEKAPESPDSIVIPDPPPERPRRHTAPGATPTILAVGDSVSMAMTIGLHTWAGDRKAHVLNHSQLGCPIARGGMYKFQRDTLKFGDYCEWAEMYPSLVAAHRPDVVMISSGIWEIVDRQLVGDDRYRHIGDPLVDRYILSEFVRAIDALGSNGATVAVLTQPEMKSGLDQGFQDLPESEPARIDRLNELIREAVKLRPGVAVLVDLRSWMQSLPTGESDPAKRPDGIHFTDEAAIEVAKWLGPKLIDIAEGR